MRSELPFTRAEVGVVQPWRPRRCQPELLRFEGVYRGVLELLRGGVLSGTTEEGHEVLCAHHEAAVWSGPGWVVYVRDGERLVGRESFEDVVGAVVRFRAACATWAMLSEGFP